MIRTIATLLLFAAAGQYPLGPKGSSPASGGGGGTCSRPTATHDWYAGYSGNLCTNASTACTSTGQSFYSILDSVAGNPAQYPTSLTYTLSDFGSQPGITAGSGAGASFGTSIASTGQHTWFAVVRPSSSTASMALIGGASGALEWRFNSGAMNLLVQQTAEIGASTSSSYTAGTVYAVAVTWDSSTGNWAFYNCHGGTCYADGSGTYGGSAPSNPIIDFMAAPPDGAYWEGDVAEVIHRNTVDVSGLACWAQTEYGI